MIAYGLVKSVEVNGRSYSVNLAFDHVLRFFDLQADKGVPVEDLTDISLEILIDPEDYPKVKKLDAVTKAAIVREINDRLIKIPGKKAPKDERVFDFKQDSALIYSAFLMDYGIDLVDQQGILDWRKFMALLQGVSERTRLREVIAIRAKEVPQPNKHNSKEIRALLDAKAYYALTEPDNEGDGNTFKRGVADLAATLIGLAKNGKS